MHLPGNLPMIRFPTTIILVGLLVSCAHLSGRLSGHLDGAEPAPTSPAGFTIEQARELLALDGDIELNHLRDISLEVAEVLGDSGHDIELNGLTSLSVEVAAALTRPDACLSLNGLADISPDLAGELLTGPRSLELDGLTSLNDALAERMGGFRGYLRLGGVKVLSDRQAELLAKHEGYLGLQGLETLSEPAAASLGRHRGVLCLNAVSSISAQAAAALAEHGTFLRLDGLTALDDDVAAALSTQRGALGLRGITSLSDAAAAALARHDGTLYLLGLRELSAEAAAALRKNPGVRLPVHLQKDGETALVQVEEEEETLITAGELVAAGKLEIDSRFRAARPMWSYDGLETLNESWAEEADDPAERARMEALHEYSKAWWAEMDLRYGLHPTTPDFGQDFAVALGLVRTEATVVGSTAPGMSSNCRLCHSTVLFTNPDPHNPQPKFAEGIPNAFLDFERFHQNVATTGGTSRGFLFAKNLPRFFADSADFFGILVPVLRPDGIKPSVLRYEKFFMADHGSSYTKKLEAKVPLIPFLKPQPWTNYRYKTNGTEGQGLYVDGGFSGNVADVTYAMAISRDHLGADFAEARETFKQCVPAYFSSLKTPRYPFIADVTEARADSGQAIYDNSCRSCHGEFRKTGPKAYELVDFPGRLVDQDELGTDPLRILGLWDLDNEEKKKFLSGSVTVTHQYVAPPLVGIWARGPYLHNASVPTVYDLLKPSSRPRKYSMRPSSTDPRNYDQEKIGWKYVDQSAKSHEEVLELMAHDPYIRIFDPDWRSAEDWETLRQALAGVKNVKVDATKPELYTGMLNTGHTYGDGLSEEERLDLLEFLKCL